jgi:hypothetical protein
MTCFNFLAHCLENQKYKSPREIFRNFCFTFITGININDAIYFKGSPLCYARHVVRNDVVSGYA